MRFMVVCLLATAAMTSIAQESGSGLRNLPGTAPDWVVPRTEHGHPDLQGTWFFGSRTPWQRPAGLAGQRTFSQEEVAQREQAMRERLERQDAPLNPDRGAPESGARIGQEADDAFLAHWQEPRLVPVNDEFLTSVIVNPPDGRLPGREGFRDLVDRQRASGLGATDGPEGQPLSGRCLMFGAAVPSLTPIMMNPNLQIVQTRDYVMIMTEMIHDARIVRLNGGHHEPVVARWMGDSIGHWEGDTLVVHSIGFRPDQSSSRSLPMSEDFELVERYTRVSDSEIQYAFTVSDPQAYDRPFSGVRTLLKNGPEARIYEFACHEGNYSLSGILAGARREQVERELRSEP